MNKKDRLLKSSLSELVERFKQADVVTEMERRYQSAPAKLISTDAIDDNAFISQVEITKKTIDAFAQTLSSRGFYSPLVVKAKGDRYEIILGRKRLFGAKAAGIVSLPAVIASLTEEEELLVLLADNRDQRESHILEMAYVCAELEKKYGYTSATLASLSHQSRSQVANTLRLLGLPKQLRRDLNEGKLSYGHARAILTLNEADQLALANQVYAENLSVRATEDKAKAIREAKNQDDPVAKWCQKEGIQCRESKKGLSFVFESEADKEKFLSKIGVIKSK